MKSVSYYLKRIERSRSKRRRMQSVLSVLSVIVAMGVVWQLRLPGITMTDPTYCGLESHAHTDACYAARGAQILNCIQTGPVVHAHDARCYDASGAQLCMLAEVEVHQHEDACYQQTEITVDPGHSHGDSCYAWTTPEQPGCGQEEVAGHVHVDTCFEWTKSDTLLCNQEASEIHTHEDACYVWNKGEATVCGQEESLGHSYSDPCFVPVKGGLLCEEEERDPVMGLGEPKLICDKKEIQLHTHEASCYSVSQETQEQTLVCTLPEIVAHQHGDTCFQEAVPELVCELEENQEHTHIAQCYKIWEQICALEEHVHTVECELTEEEQHQIEIVMDAIAALPSAEEIREELEDFGEEDAEDRDEYLEAVKSEVTEAKEAYAALSEKQQKAVANADKLDAYDFLFESEEEYPDIEGTELEAMLDDGSVYASIVTNAELPEGAQFVMTQLTDEEDDTLIRELQTIYNYLAEEEKVLVQSLPLDMHFTDKDGNEIEVKGTTEVKLMFDESVLPGEEEIVVLHVAQNQAENVLTSVEDFGASTFSLLEEESTTKLVTLRTDSFSTIVVGRATPVLRAAKPAKDNTSKLHIIPAADTSEFIELNLYDYGNNINTLYGLGDSGAHIYPGFQQDYGTNAVSASVGTYQMNFGNNITSDLEANRYTSNGTVIKDTTITNSGGAINATYRNAEGKVDVNYPISGAMDEKLGSDGYPKLKTGQSLKYLFSQNTYATKMNAKTINGLFQYDATTGAYNYNSRENHAQFVQSENKFTLYQERISSNYIMYPFGNFLPFNDIVHKSQQATLFNKSYFETLASSASSKGGTDYNTLSTVLTNFKNNMASGWTPASAVKYYFDKNGIPATVDNNHLATIYNIDYDEPTNFYFGMDMTMELMQPKDGLTGLDGNQKMYFYFTGDDDVWVYIDGILTLDLSGIHRHVGGAIDFERGVVMYFSLNKNTGDVGTLYGEHYDLVPFEDIFPADMLHETGAIRANGSKAMAFIDYSKHEFKFYYMERGAGSSVCRLNFNFPQVRKNSINVTKEVTEETGKLSQVMGDPDYKFQILKAGTNELFIGPNTTYTIKDKGLMAIGTGTTDANGVFTLKAGQTAEFAGIEENSGQYFVRELLEPEVYAQYGYSITVDGAAITQNDATQVVVGTETFQGVDSPVKDMADGSTTFDYDNTVIFDKLGNLEIQKILTEYAPARDALQFEFMVTLDGVPLPVGTSYTVGSESRTITAEGRITLAPGEKAVISNILAGSKFTVQETAASAEGYTIDYSGDNVTVVTPADAPAYASGKILLDASVTVAVNNSENGAIVEIPVEKTLTNPDGAEHSYSFVLEQVTDSTGATLTENGTRLTTSATFPAVEGDQIPANQQQSVFQLSYLEKTTPIGKYYYKITETSDENPLVVYDDTVYVAEVTVSKTEGVFTAAITGLWVDGVSAPQTAAAAFQNALLTNLSISKIIGGIIQPTEEFTFTVSMDLTLDGEPLTGTYPTRKGEEEGTITLDDQGTATFTLKGGETFLIQNLPSGVAWTVEENNTAGYSVTYQIGDVVTDGTVAQGTATGPETGVIFTNAAFYKLPDTGSSGTLPYLLGGLLLMAAPLKYESSRRRRGRRQQR